MIKREADFGTLFRHWLMANPKLFTSTAFELKQTRSNALAFDAVADHQLDALTATKWGSKGLLFKAPDDSRGVKPYDFFYMKNAYAYVVIKYPDMFCLIDANTFIKEKEMSLRKSLTSERAREIAWKTVNI